MKADKETSKERLHHIADAIRKIEIYTADASEITFSENPMLHDAVLYQFSIIGEAIPHVGNEFLDKYDYPWHQVRAFRNLIAHQYFGVRLDKVWSIIENDLPALKKIVELVNKKEF
jgi:uncharacterized protein with HEPN domain